MQNSAKIIPFPKVPLRALVVIPAELVGHDICEVRQGGWPIDGKPVKRRGSLSTVMMTIRSDGRGLPVTVHPECERRAGI